MEAIKPNALKEGGTVGIVAPASPVPEERVRKSLKFFQRFGYKVKLGKTVEACHGYLAGPDDWRARDINEMFADPEVEAIICLRGGYGTPRILDLIDYEMIKRNPKIFVGYSDITALHQAIHRVTGLITFHGPMIAELAELPHPLTWPTLWRHLTNPFPIGRYCEPPGMSQCCIREGMAEGRLTGGNLSLLTATLGSKYELQTEGRILFIEDIGEEPYSIDRMLTQLKMAGKLQVAKGIVFTDFREPEKKENKPGFTLEQVLDDVIGPLGVPAFYGLKAGHCQPNLTLPIGVQARMNAKEGWLEFLESGVTLQRV